MADAFNMWFEKYRPRTLDDIVLPPNKIQLVKRWFQDFQEGKARTSGLLFTGPPGLGKTSMAHIILREYGYKVREFNASDTRSKSLIHENLYGLINITDVNRVVNRDEPPVAIIMDEVDGMFKSDRGGVDELLTFITEQRRVPIICICNLGNVKKDTIKGLQKECLEVNFQLPDEGQMLQVLRRVTCGEGMHVSAEAENMIIGCAQQDFRRLVGILEFLHAGAHDAPITEETFNSYYGILAQKEKDLHITDSIRQLLNERLSYDAIARIYNADKSKAPMVVHQNYLKAISLQHATPAQKLQGAICCMSSLVTSDVIEKIMYNTQCWYLQPVQGYASTLVPSYYINRYPKSTRAGSSWASVLSISSQSQNLKKNMHEVLYNVNSRHTYQITDIQNLIEVIYHNLMHEHLEEAARMLVSYDICDLGELENKKALNVLDKMSKFIKLSRYYKEWQTFKERMKANKEFDTNLKTFIKTMQGPGMKITTRRGRPSKIAATQAPKIAATQAPKIAATQAPKIAATQAPKIAATQAPKIAATQAPKIAATPMRPVLTPVPISPVSKSREEQIQLVQKRITVTIKKRQ